MNGVWRRVWGSIEEPRNATLLSIAAYLTAMMAGLGLLIAPPVHPLSGVDAVLRWFGALALLGGGVLGAPSAWAGWWWVERSAATAAVAGMAVALLEVAAVAWPGGPSMYLPWLTVPTAMLGLILFLVRLARVTRQPFAPGKGPSLPDDAAGQVLAKMISDETEYVCSGDHDPLFG